MRNPIPFDTHAYVKRLIAAGVPESQAEVHAQAFVEVVIEQLATKQDLALQSQDIRAEIEKLRAEMHAALKDLELRLTIRMGVMLMAAVAAIAALVKLMG